MANFKVEVKGMSEVGAALDKLPPEFGGKAVVKAMAEAANVGLAAVQSEAAPHIRTGNLYGHIVARRNKNVDPAQQVQFLVYVQGGKKRGGYGRKDRKGPRVLWNTPPYYWYFLEFGWSHKPEGAPFLRPGFQKSAGEAAQRARDIAAYWVQRYKP